MSCYFDKKNYRLVFTKNIPTTNYWDSYWSIDNSIRLKIFRVKDTMVTKVTKKYIKPEDGPVLEGGCGNGIHVAALVNNGYQCIGIDSAVQTIKTINNSIPELDIRLGDVRQLDFQDQYFAAYWSLGVIEHFWEGYEPVGMEMARVIKPGGYLFLTFPYLSPLRRFKAWLGMYPVHVTDHPPTSFYQFGLDHKLVALNFLKWGFKLLKVKPMLGLRAAKEEIGFLNPLLQRLYDYRGNSVLIRSLGVAFSVIFTRFSGHICLLIFKKMSYT